jgi:hypothetical protein
MTSFDFDLDGDLELFQTASKGYMGIDAVPIRTVGEFRVQPSQSHGTKGRVEFDIHVSHPSLSKYVTIGTEGDAISVNSPNSARVPLSAWHLEHCISILGNIYLPSKTALENLDIETTQLAIQIFRPTEFTVNRTTLKSITGNVFLASEEFNKQKSFLSASPRLPTFPSAEPSQGQVSREVIVDVVSGSVTGSYPLLDLLSITTKSGDISIDVIPKCESERHPAPAQLRIKSVSGAVSVGLPQEGIPDRDYQTSVNTISGTISGSFLLDSTTTFDSISGDIDISLLPLHVSTTSNLDTQSRSGNTDVYVLEPVQECSISNVASGDGDTILDAMHMRHLNSKHSGISGSVKLRYPKAWEGKITAETLSGSISVGGDGISVIRGGKKDIVRREVVAVKGDKWEIAGETNVMASSGNVDVKVG